MHWCLCTSVDRGPAHTGPTRSMLAASGIATLGFYSVRHGLPQCCLSVRPGVLRACAPTIGSINKTVTEGRSDLRRRCRGLGRRSSAYLTLHLTNLPFPAPSRNQNRRSHIMYQSSANQCALRYWTRDRAQHPGSSGLHPQGDAVTDGSGVRSPRLAHRRATRAVAPGNDHAQAAQIHEGQLAEVKHHQTGAKLSNAQGAFQVGSRRDVQFTRQVHTCGSVTIATELADESARTGIYSAGTSDRDA